MTDLRLGTQGFYSITHTGIVSKNWGRIFVSIHFMMLANTFFCAFKIFPICAIMFCVLSYPSENWLSESEILPNLFRKRFFFQDTDCKCNHKSQHQSSIKALKALLQDQELYFRLISRKFLTCCKKNRVITEISKKYYGYFPGSI